MTYKLLLIIFHIQENLLCNLTLLNTIAVVLCYFLIKFFTMQLKISYGQKYTKTYWYFVIYNIYTWFLLYKFSTINMFFHPYYGLFLLLSFNSSLCNVLFLAFLIFKKRTIYDFSGRDVYFHLLVLKAYIFLLDRFEKVPYSSFILRYTSLLIIFLLIFLFVYVLFFP